MVHANVEQYFASKPYSPSKVAIWFIFHMPYVCLETPGKVLVWEIKTALKDVANDISV